MLSKEHMPIVSIIVPVYNVEKYLTRTIESLKKQTLHNIEIILVDDKSCDGSYEICKQQELEDDRITTILLDRNRGVAAARNAGLSIAKGEYVSFIDSDDWIEPDMLEYLVDLAKKHNADVSTCGIVKDYPNKRHIAEENGKNVLTSGMEIINEINYGGEFKPYLVNKIFTKRILSGLRLQEGITIGEDYRFIMEIMMRNPVVVHGEEIKYHYVQHASSISYRGFSNCDNVYKNRMNYKDTYEMLITYDEKLSHGALAYYILQEMAVPISMVKAGCYDSEIIRNVKKNVRKYIGKYLILKRVPLYLKGCAILLSIHEQLLLIPYKIMFHKARSVTE